MEERSKQEFVPVEKWHKTHTFTGPGKIKPLPVSVIKDEYGTSLNSVWRLPSIWQRIKFLFTGEVTLRVYGNALPPVAVVAGDIYGAKP